MNDAYKNNNEYNLGKTLKVLIVSDTMIADLISDNKINKIVTKLLIRGRKINISIVFILQSYHKIPKNVRKNTTHFFIMKIPNRQELQQIVSNQSSSIEFKDFRNLYKKDTVKLYLFRVVDTSFSSDKAARFRKKYKE